MRNFCSGFSNFITEEVRALAESKKRRLRIRGESMKYLRGKQMHSYQRLLKSVVMNLK
jgi:hypothetical protein